MLVSTPPTPGTRTGRRPGTSGTRERILRVAAARFVEHGYAATSLRAVAREANVDPALVVHFFKTKAGLFIGAMDWPFDPAAEIPAVLAAGPDGVGRRLVTLFVAHWDDEQQRSPIIALLHAATADPNAARLLREFVQEQVAAPVMAHLDADQPDLRAGLVASQMVGLGMARYALAFEPLASTPPGVIIATIGDTIQRYCTAPLPSSDGERPVPS